MKNIFVEKIKESLDRCNGNKIAFRYIENSNIVSEISYFELLNKINLYEIYFNSLNLNNKIYVLYMSANVEFIPVLFGCINAGIIPIIRTIGESVSKDKLFNQLDELKKEMNFIDGVITNYNYPELSDYCVNNNLNYIDLENKNSNILYINPNVELDADIILLTSGSTKTSKGVKLTLEQLLSNVLLCKNLWNINENDICLNWMPHSHIYGLITGFLLPIYTFGTSYIMNPKEFSNHFDTYFKALSDLKITHTHTPASNLFLEKGIKYHNNICDNFDLKNLKTISLGGEAINYNLLEQFSNIYSKYNLSDNTFSPNYGMSEISGLLTAIKINENIHVIDVDEYDLKMNNRVKISNKFNSCKLVSIGRINKNETYIFEPDTFKKLPNREIGEIVLSLHSMSNGYVDISDNINTFVNKDNKIFYRTGDLGFLDDDYLIVTGRLKEIIKIKGKNISPYEIENCIITNIDNKLINNVVSFSKQDNIHNKEDVGIFVESNISVEKEKKFKEDIYNLLKNKLQIKVDINNILVLRHTSIPRFSNGKISRKKCNELFNNIKDDEYEKS